MLHQTRKIRSSLVEQFSEVERYRMQRQIFGLYFLQIDQLIYHGKEVAGIAVDHLQVLFSFAVGGLSDQLPGWTQDECQRCFKLMGNIGEIGDLIFVQLFHLLRHLKDRILLLVDLFVLMLQLFIFIDDLALREFQLLDGTGQC